MDTSQKRMSKQPINIRKGAQLYQSPGEKS